MIFRAETFHQVDPMLPAKSPETKRNQRVDPFSQCKRDKAGADFARLRENFTLGMATEPGLVAMSVQPVYLETGPIFLPAPTPAAFQKKKFHEDVSVCADSPRFSRI